MKAARIAPNLKRRRDRLAATVVIGHAVKHIYNSGLHSLLLREIKIGLGLNATQYGALFTARQATSWGTTMGAGYLGDRFSSKAPLLQIPSPSSPKFRLFVAFILFTPAFSLLGLKGMPMCW